jgi:NAD(P)-dependent dehydrogenase (short-subunit alcohol dehydrogenase family)
MKRAAIVTGASRGIGEAIVRRLAADGWAVALVGRRGLELGQLADRLEEMGARAWARPLDLRDMDGACADELAREAAVKLGAPVEALVNNAGIAVSEALPRLADELWADHLAVNLTAPFRLTRAVLPDMLARRSGRIVNVASVAAESPLAYAAAYAASKAGLVGFTKAAAAEVAGKGITVNAVCPGWVDTDMAREGFSRAAAKTGRPVEEIATQLVERSSQKRMLEPKEVADLVAYLLSPQAAGINGQAWVIGGP